MQDRKEIWNPIIDRAVGPFTPWVPPKKLEEEFKGYKILVSDAEASPKGTLQLAVVHPDISGEMLRADSYQEGYFSAVWSSGVKLQEFLEETERYFQEFESRFTGDTHGVLGVFASSREREFYEFTRPVLVEDFEREDIFIGNDDHPLSLLRIDTFAGNVCYMPADKSVGIIAYLDHGKDQPTIDAMARLVTRTQALLPEDLVAETIRLLPYRRITS